MRGVKRIDILHPGHPDKEKTTRPSWNEGCPWCESFNLQVDEMCHFRAKVRTKYTQLSHDYQILSCLQCGCQWKES